MSTCDFLPWTYDYILLFVLLPDIRSVSGLRKGRLSALSNHLKVCLLDDTPALRFIIEDKREKRKPNFRVFGLQN